METDRISCLHDSLLHQIFSFLPTNDVVKTTLLSKRWKDLWKSFPYLHLDESNFINHNSFTNFVHKFLLHRDMSNSIVTVQLVWENPPQSSHIKPWISAAVRAGVQELQLYSRCEAIGLELPSCLYNCNSLVTLKLKIRYGVQFPDKFCFPNMKIMNVYGVIFAKNFSDQLLKSTNLQELFLSHCKIDQSHNSTSPKFQDIIADDRHHSSSFSHLNIAIIGIGNPFGEADGGLSASKLIKTLSNVEVLWLSNSCIQLLQCSGRDLLDYLPTFSNLKHLKLILSIKDGDVGVMGCLLHRSPVLQSLDIKFIPYNFKTLVSRCKRELKPDDLSRRLKSIEMDHFRGSKNQIELVKFFLANAQALEKMILHMHSHLEPTWQKLFEFPRLSTTCEIILMSDTSYDNFYPKSNCFGWF